MAISLKNSYPKDQCYIDYPIFSGTYRKDHYVEGNSVGAFSMSE